MERTRVPPFVVIGGPNGPRELESPFNEGRTTMENDPDKCPDCGSDPVVNDEGEKFCPTCHADMIRREMNLRKETAQETSDRVLHPNGRCTCAGEGKCEWCLTYGTDMTPLGMGADPQPETAALVTVIPQSLIPRYGSDEYKAMMTEARRMLRGTAYDRLVALGAYPAVDEGHDETAEDRRRANREAFIEQERARFAQIAYDAWIKAAPTQGDAVIAPIHDEFFDVRWLAVVDAIMADRHIGQEMLRKIQERKKARASGPTWFGTTEKLEEIKRDIKMMFAEMCREIPDYTKVVVAQYEKMLEGELPPLGQRDHFYYRLADDLATRMAHRSPAELGAAFPQGEDEHHLTEKIARVRDRMKPGPGKE